MRNDSRATIVDVAALAGVHAGTVSRALSRPDKVAPATRERVEAAVRELGFVPSRAARGLITGKTGYVGVIVPDITNPYFAVLVRSIEHAARDADFQVLLVDTGERRDEEVRAARGSPGRSTASSCCRRAACTASSTRSATRRPCSSTGRYPAGHRYSCGRRPRRGRPCATLAEVGHTKVTYLRGPQGSWAAIERRDAVRRTSRASGVEIVEIALDDPTFEGGVTAVEQSVGNGSTAVIAFNDQMALGVLAGLTQRGIRVPDDMSIVGCDDVPMAAMVAPPLTTIRMPTDEAGAVAVGLLADSTAKVELFGSLVVRASTGPVVAKPKPDRRRR